MVVASFLSLTSLCCLYAGHVLSCFPLECNVMYRMSSKSWSQSIRPFDFQVALFKKDFGPRPMYCFVRSFASYLLICFIWLIWAYGPLISINFFDNFSPSINCAFNHFLTFFHQLRRCMNYSRLFLILSFFILSLRSIMTYSFTTRKFLT